MYLFIYVYTHTYRYCIYSQINVIYIYIYIYIYLGPSVPGNHQCLFEQQPYVNCPPYPKYGDDVCSKLLLSQELKSCCPQGHRAIL